MGRPIAPRTIKIQTALNEGTSVPVIARRYNVTESYVYTMRRRLRDEGKLSARAKNFAPRMQTKPKAPPVPTGPTIFFDRSAPPVRTGFWSVVSSLFRR